MNGVVGNFAIYAIDAIDTINAIDGVDVAKSGRGRLQVLPYTVQDEHPA